MSENLTAKTFAPHLLAVLAELTEDEANLSVPMEETYQPVCARMGIDENHGGEVSGGYRFTHRKIGLAFRQHLRGKGLGELASKGQWMLTPEGVDEARNITGLAAPEMEEELEAFVEVPVVEEKLEVPVVVTRTDATAELIEVVELVEVDEKESAEVLRLPVIQKHPYSDDPYIRALGTEAVPCYGAWSSRSDTCKECPLVTDCRMQVGAWKSELAGALATEEEQFQARVQQAAEDGKTVEELIAELDDEDTGPVPGGGKQGKFKPAKGQDYAKAKASRKSLCLHCQEPIPKGEWVRWCADEGVFHLACFDDTDA